MQQYTVRNIPGPLDAALRRRAREEGKSLNEIVVQALARGVGFSKEAVRQRDLSDLAGTWKRDAAFETAIAEQDRVDEAIWK
jgi:plasmid stability protein